jgi:hypothetical protein
MTDLPTFGLPTSVIRLRRVLSSFMDVVLASGLNGEHYQY